MKKVITITVLFFALALFGGVFLMPNHTRAGGNTANTSTPTSAGIGIPTSFDSNGSITNTTNSFSTWGDYLGAVYRFAEYIGFALATLMIVYAGIMYVTSQGDSGKISTAKEYVIGALVGMALLYLVNTLAHYMNIGGVTTTVKTTFYNSRFFI
jgi:hypothetical protein